MGLSGKLAESLGLDRMKDLIAGGSANEDEEEKEDNASLQRKLHRAERRIVDLEDEVSELTEKLKKARRRTTGSSGSKRKKLKVKVRKGA